MIQYLTDLVEEAVLNEFQSLQQRGGVLAAMETMYQRSKIQEESLEYEHSKHSGQIPIIGVNTFLSESDHQDTQKPSLSRSTDEEKNFQVEQVKWLHNCFSKESADALCRLQQAVLKNENIFESLMDITPVCTLGQITHALYAVGGAYRRNM